MHKSWLRGMLLGVSVALLLAGGVALAQTLTLEVDQACAECWPGPYNGPPPEQYMVRVTMDGWDPTETMCLNIWANGESLFPGGPSCGSPPPVAPPYDIMLMAIPCGAPGGASVGVRGLDVQVQAKLPEEIYGEWKVRVWQPGTDNADSVTWLFAEDCEALAGEFVPEPGTIALLGSGLAGLAGYATLRWRSRR